MKLSTHECSQPGDGPVLLLVDCEPEVCHFEHTILAEEQVLRLQIAVNDVSASGCQLFWLERGSGLARKRDAVDRAVQRKKEYRMYGTGTAREQATGYCGGNWLERCLCKH